jgi:hypothetical protein
MKTTYPVIAMSSAATGHAAIVEAALRKGAHAVADAGRPDFYDLEVDGHCYYIHVSKRLQRVYLVAVLNEAPLTLSAAAGVSGAIQLAV